MIKYATIFIILAIISAFVGYGEIIGGASGIAKIIFFIFIILYVVSLLKAGLHRT